MYNWFDRFCYKYEKYGIRNLMVFIIIGNIAIFLLDLSGLENVYQTIVFNPYLVLQGEWWRVLTFVFIPPSSSPIFIIFVLYFYYWIGNSLENHWGRLKFTIYYFSGVLFTIVYSFLVVLIYTGAGHSPLAIISASGVSNTYVNMALFLAFATLFPDMQIRLFFLIPVKVKWMGIADAVLLLLGMLSQPLSLVNFTPLIALGNYLIFFGPSLVKLIKRRNKNSRRTVNFKAAVREARSDRGYIHKCSLCGVTDTDSPESEFRYCSLCSGYQCYCSQHIFTHEHKKG